MVSMRMGAVVSTMWGAVVSMEGRRWKAGCWDMRTQQRRCRQHPSGSATIATRTSDHSIRRPSRKPSRMAVCALSCAL